jgi:hypothetical protein
MTRWLTRCVVPAAFLLAAALATAPLSDAANSGSKSVTMNIVASVDVNLAGCPPIAGQISLQRSGAAATAPNECRVDFGTTNGTSARLRATDGDDTWSMQQTPSLLTIPDLPFGTPSTLPRPSGGVGICLAAVGGPTTANMVMSAGCPTGANAWYGLRATSPFQIATTNTVGTGQAHLWLGGNVAVGSAAGGYDGSITFEVLSP